MTDDDRLFSHQPPGALREHDLILFVDWGTDEPNLLVCEVCGVHWSVGPRVPGIPLRVSVEGVEGATPGCRPKPPPNGTP